MRQPTHFLEIVKDNGTIKCLSICRYHLLRWALEVNSKHNLETIAIFKIYPHPKPIIAEFDKEVNAIIVNHE